MVVGAKRLKTRGQMLANSFDIIILETAEQMVKVHTHQILGVAQVKSFKCHETLKNKKCLNNSTSLTVVVICEEYLNLSRMIIYTKVISS